MHKPLVALCCAFAALAAQAQGVTAPPLPQGSARVSIEPGMSAPERNRQERAHEHKQLRGRDYTRDDSVHGAEIARDTGTKGASSWFYAPPPKGK